MEKCIVLKFYENGKYLPSYDEYYNYDLNDDNSFMRAYMEASYRLCCVCNKNKNIFGRIETLGE